MYFQMHVPTKLLFGEGRLKELHKETLPGKKALLVISNGKSAALSGGLDIVKEQLKLAGVGAVLFAGVEQNPLRTTVMAGAKIARENSCDFVVALGGGSVMDAAKAMAAMATNDGDLWDYMGGGSGKGKALSHTPLPMVAITTSAGTGSEADPWGVITDCDLHEKMGFTGLYPELSIIDPTLMLTVPPALTAYQGFDALFHSTESYIACTATPMSDMYALTAIENIARHLPTAVRDGANLEARSAVAFANTVSGVVMTLSSCISEHSMEHAMSAYHQDLPHGAGLIMISIEYYRHFISTHVCDERFVRMAKAMGMENASKPDDFITALAALQKACGVSELKMSDYGIELSECDTLAQNSKHAMGGLFECDPCPLSHEDCRGIFERAYR